MTSLRHVSLHGCNELTFKQLRTIGTHCTALRSLNIGGDCKRIKAFPNELVDVLLRHYTTLVSLDISDTPALDIKHIKKLVTGGGLSLTIHESVGGHDDTSQHEPRIGNKELCNLSDDLFELYILKRESAQLKSYYNNRQKKDISNKSIAEIKKHAITKTRNLDTLIEMYNKERQTIMSVIGQCKKKRQNTVHEGNFFDVENMTLGEYTALLHTVYNKSIKKTEHAILPLHTEVETYNTEDDIASVEFDNSHISTIGTYLPFTLWKVTSDKLRARLRHYEIDIIQLEKMLCNIEERIVALKYDRVIALAHISPMFRLEKINVTTTNTPRDCDITSLVQWLMILPRITASSILY